MWTNLVEREAEVEELRHGGRQVVDGPVDVVDVEVARDRAGPQSLGEGAPGHREGERAAPVADVEVDAARGRLARGAQHLALAVEDALLAAVEAVGQHVAGPQLVQDRGERQRRLADVDHDGQPRRLRRLQGGRQRDPGVVAYDVP
jgi:hypothetical protein